MTTFPNIMLPSRLVLQHFQNRCCQTHWFYNSLKHNVAETIGFTPFLNKQLLQHLTVDIFKINVANTNGFSNMLRQLFTTFPNIMLLKPLILKHSQQSYCQTKFYNILKNNMLKPMVLHFFWNKQLVANIFDCCHFQKQCC